MCLGMDVCKEKMEEIKAKDKISDVEEKMYTTLEMCYEFYLRGFTFGKMNLYESAATEFLMDEAHQQLIPPFTSIPGLGEAAAGVHCRAAEKPGIYFHRGAGRRLPQGVQGTY